jgi:large subunit ribosomal protein L32e
MADSRLLDTRKKAKKRKPHFVVKESKFRAGVKSRWRQVRGMHSKVRQCHKGRPIMPSTGFGSPKAVRGLDRSGFEPVVVKNLDQLNSLNKETQAAVIGSTVGKKKKSQLLTKALENAIKVLNVKSIEDELKLIKAKFDTRVELRSKKIGSRVQKQKANEKVAKEKKKNEKKESVEDKLKAAQEEEKKQAQKTFTKRQ